MIKEIPITRLEDFAQAQREIADALAGRFANPEIAAYVVSWRQLAHCFLTYPELAKIVGLSKQRVQGIHQKATEILRRQGIDIEGEGDYEGLDS